MVKRSKKPKKRNSRQGTIEALWLATLKEMKESIAVTGI